MTTGGENELLRQIASDVTELKVTLGRVDTRIIALGDTALDHEGRIRQNTKDIDDIRANYVLKSTVRWAIGIIIAAAAVIVAYLTGLH